MHEEESPLESKIREISLEESIRIMEEDKKWFYDNLEKLREKYGKKGYVLIRNKEEVGFDKKKARLLNGLKYSAYLGDLSSERTEEEPILSWRFPPQY